MRRTGLQFLHLAVAVVLSLLLGTAALAQGESRVRFVHVFPDAPNVDVYVNDDVVAEDVAYGEASDYVTVPTGDIEVAATATGDSEALFSQTVTTGADPVTLVVSGDDGFVRYTDNLDPLELGEARLTAIHAINDGPTVDVILEDGRPVVPGLNYGIPFGTLDLPVLKLPLNVIPAGEDASATLFDEPVTLSPTMGTSYAVVVYGTVDAPEVLVLASAVNPSPGDGLLQVVHDIPEVDAVDLYAGDNLISVGVASETMTEAFPIPAGDYNLQVALTDTIDILVSTDVTVSEGRTTTATIGMAGGAPIIEFEIEANDVAVVEADEGVTETSSEVVQVEPTPVTAEEVVPAPTAAEDVVVQPTAAPVAASEQPTARVTIDPGANLQLRQYPDSTALSLGRAPSGSTLIVNGREGAPVQIEGLFSEELQAEIDAYSDPAEDLEPDEDLNPDDTWLNVAYQTPDGGTITAWVLADFLDVNAPDGDAQRLADLETIPANAFGESEDTEVTPPPVGDDQIIAEVFNLNPGVNLNIRRTPSINGEVLARVVSGTDLELIGLGIEDDESPTIATAEEAEWLFVRYQSPEGGEITGWTSTLYVRFQYRGEPIDFEEMEARDLLLFEDVSTRGELGGGVAAVPRPTVDPLRNQAVAQVTIDPGANLQFRRDADASSESLGLIPSGTQLIVTARDSSGEWLFVEFDGQTGWVSSDFVRLTYNDEPLDIDELLVDDGS